MGILGEKYEGRKVIGLSGHKSESTVKQYISRLSAKTKREMSGTLAESIQPRKQAKTNQNKFTFRQQKLAATQAKAPEENHVHVPDDPTMQVIQLDAENNEENQPENMEFQLQALDDAPPDDVLINFLSQFDPVPAPQQQPHLQPLAHNNTMNISNVKNVQNVQDNQPKLPNMYFGGNSTVTINYNFGPSK